MRAKKTAIGDGYFQAGTYDWEVTDGDGGEIDYRADLVVEGNVGVGTVNPATNIHIASAGDAAITLEADTDNATEQDNAYIRFLQDNRLIEGFIGHASGAGVGPLGACANAIDNAFILGTPDIATDSALQLATAGAVRMTLDTAGNVGVGTMSPQAKLHELNGSFLMSGNSTNDFPVITTATQINEIRGVAAENLAADAGNLILSAGGGTTLNRKMSIALHGYGSVDDSQIRLLGGNTAIMTLLYTGNVGIGTTAPNKKLEVNTAHAINIDDEIRIGSYYLGNFYGLGLNYRIDAAGNPSQHLVSYNSGTKTTNFSFLTNGNVGIGLTPLVSNPKLHVNGAIGATGYIGAGCESNCETSGGYGIIYANGEVLLSGTCEHGTLPCGSDIAEGISASAQESFESGDVAVIAKDGVSEFVAKSTKSFDSRVAGVFSSVPGMYLSGKGKIEIKPGGYDFTKQFGVDSEGNIPLALAGQVPVKVTLENGTINKGDLLTTSSTPGYAMKFKLIDIKDAKNLEELKEMLSANEVRRNSILGKALESFDGQKGDAGKIMVLLTLR